MINEKRNNMKWLLIGILLLSGCTKDGFLQPKRDIEMSIDSNGKDYFEITNN